MRRSKREDFPLAHEINPEIPLENNFRLVIKENSATIYHVFVYLLCRRTLVLKQMKSMVL